MEEGKESDFERAEEERDLLKDRFRLSLISIAESEGQKIEIQTLSFHLFALSIALLFSSFFSFSPLISAVLCGSALSHEQRKNASWRYLNRSWLAFLTSPSNSQVRTKP